MATNRVAMKRLSRDLQDLEANPVACVAAEPLEDDLFTWRMTLSGPRDSTYEHTAWLAEISFPGDYPKAPPKCAFLTDIPFSAGGTWNNEQGRQVLCLSILGGEEGGREAGRQGGRGGREGREKVERGGACACYVRSSYRVCVCVCMCVCTLIAA
jgi:hypothetical protein